MTDVDKLNENGFQRVAEFVISEANHQGMITDSMIVEDIILNVVDNDLYNTNDMLYAFVAGEEVIYVGETERTLNERYRNGYYHKLRNWKHSKSSSERFSEEFSKADIIDIYAMPAKDLMGYVTAPFGTVLSLRKIIEDDMVTYFDPILNPHRPKV
jgi:hypothetical protein